MSRTIPKRTVWRDEAAKARLETWYDRFRAKIAMPTESMTVSSRIGPSHLLVAGPVDAPPLICLHAMRTGAAHLLSELGPLLSRFRIYAPDLPGQSVRGPQVKLPLHDDTGAVWLGEVMDGLGLSTTDLFGVSWGGFLASKTAATIPDRIHRLALLVPAGIANGSHWRGLTRMAWPMLRYRLRPSLANLRRMLEPLITSWDDDWASFMGESIRDMPMDLRIPPLATDDHLRRLTMPVLALGAAEDISFPGAAIIRRLKSVIPNCAGEVIPHCKHCPPTTPEFRMWLSDRLTRFFS